MVLMCNESVSLWPLGSTCCLLTPETHPKSQLTGHNRLAQGFCLGFSRLSLGTYMYLKANLMDGL